MVYRLIAYGEGITMFKKVRSSPEPPEPLDPVVRELAR